MFRIRIFYLFTGLLLTIAALTFLGCSIIGFVIGSRVDASKPDKRSIPGWDVINLQMGKRITVTTRNGKMLQGTYKGSELMGNQDYQQKYQDKRSRHPEYLLPDLNENISVVTRKDTYGGKFDGLIYTSLLLREEQPSKPSIRKFNISDIQQIKLSTGKVITGEVWQNMVLNRKVPNKAVIVIEGKTGITQLPLDQVETVWVKTSKNARFVGFLIGATVDALVIAAVLSSQNKEESPSTSDTSVAFSCPYVYSFDGEHYVLDSEPFGGALFRAAQRTDLDNLDYLLDVGGTYRLRIANELQETQYIDEIKLLVVDHDPAVKVAPSFRGELYGLSSLLPPEKAVNYEGADVLPLVIKRDEHFWVSNPFHREVNDRKSLRDGLILEFPRPAGSSSVRLLVNVQNTLWASYLQGKMLAFQGRDLDHWYETLNQSEALRKALLQTMVREGMLLVYAWDGQKWRYQDFIWEVGPALPKDQVVELDLSDIPGNILRIRLEVPPGFWMVNSVQADFSSNSPLKVQELSPVYAKNGTGRNILSLLLSEDGRHYVMEKTGEFAEVQFPAIQKQPGTSRTFILQISGYYTIHVQAKGEPQYARVERFMKQPGAYTRYTLELLNHYLVSEMNHYNRM